MKKILKIIICVALAFTALLGIFFAYGFSLSAGYDKCEDWLQANKALTSEDGQRITTPLIEYELLSEKYKAVFSEDELNNASEADDIYNIYIKANSVGNGIKTTDMDFYATGLKNYLYGKLYTSHGVYYVDYDIWFRVKPFTSDIYIVKWTIDMKELPEEENITETTDNMQAESSLS